MDISSDIRTRIIAAAEQLYSADNARFPTVDQVRRAARADMNSTSTVMKEWRRQQTAAPTVVAVAIPERIHEAMNAALATVWTEAQELANESLAAAQQAWEIERTEADAMRSELAEAYEQQAAHLEATEAQLEQSEAALQSTNDVCREQDKTLTDVTARLFDVERREQYAQKRIEELRAELIEEKTASEKQVLFYRAELEAQREKTELDAQEHQAELQSMREKMAEENTVKTGMLAELKQHQATIDSEFAAVKARAEAQQEAAVERGEVSAQQLEKLSKELEVAHKDAAQARETVAGLNGKLEAVTAQNKELMAAFNKPNNNNHKRK